MLEKDDTRVIAERHFGYRFPKNSTNNERVRRWGEVYDEWWSERFCREMIENLWLLNPTLAVKHLSKWQPSRVKIPPRVLEAAVCNPDIKISDAVLEYKGLTPRLLALALAHPLRSAFTVGDLNPNGIDGYVEKQKQRGMSERNISRAIELAKAITVRREPIYDYRH